LGVDYDTYEPGVRMSSEAFLADIRQLVPGDASTVVVAAGEAAGFAVHAAISGFAGGLLLFQPAADHLPPEAMTDVPFEQLVQAAAPYTPLIDAWRETDAARRLQFVTGVWRDLYEGHLTAADFALVCQVIGEHIEDLLATIGKAAVAAEAVEPAPHPGPPWVDRLGEITVPVTVVMSRRGRSVGEALANRVPAGEFVGANADTDLPWLEDRATAVSVLRRMLAR
ncbi:MAG TPA: hypothetical protein VF070_13970, partial [Streptosporangiaceae bacterium]